jgi:hypothetical protein
MLRLSIRQMSGARWGDIGRLSASRESFFFMGLERNSESMQIANANPTSSLPFKIGYDLAGTVAATGNEVTKVKVGDEVFCCLPFKDRGLIPALSQRFFLSSRK